MMTAPAPEAAPIPAEVLREFVDFVKHAPVSSGTCCCGDDMDRHSDPMSCGHSPVDMWDHALAGWLKQIEPLLVDRASREERIREDEWAPETVNALEGLFWLELREPGLVPQRKGPWPHARTKEILREFMKVNPTAYISVVTMSHDGPWFADAPETLGIVDGRCWPTARKHIASSSAAHARLRGDAS